MKKEKLYLVGYLGKEQTALYSNVAWSLKDGNGGVEKMTLSQAKKHLKTLYPNQTAHVGIFKTVLVRGTEFPKLKP